MYICLFKTITHIISYVAALAEFAIDGGWGEWQEWSYCSVSCGVGSQSRHRYCDSPRPENNGAKDCGSDGSSWEDTRECNDMPGVNCDGK